MLSMFASNETNLFQVFDWEIIDSILILIQFRKASFRVHLTLQHASLVLVFVLRSLIALADFYLVDLLNSLTDFPFGSFDGRSHFGTSMWNPCDKININNENKLFSLRFCFPFYVKSIACATNA